MTATNPDLPTIYAQMDAHKPATLLTLTGAKEPVTCFDRGDLPATKQQSAKKPKREKHGVLFGGKRINERKNNE